MALPTRAQAVQSFKNVVSTVNNKSSYTPDPRYIIFSKGTYRFKLINYLIENNYPTKKEFPWVEKYAHSSKVNDKFKTIICPTTQFAQSGFKKCPICDYVSKLYADGAGANTHALNSVYKAHKRVFSFTALVLVVNDPVNPENNGKLMLMRNGKTLHDFLMKEAYNKQIKSEDGVQQPADEDSAGMAAFIPNFSEGANEMESFDLIIEVTANASNPKWNDYTPKFARKLTKSTLTFSQIDEQVKELNIEELVKTSTEAEIKEYYEVAIRGLEGAGTPAETDDAPTQAPPTASKSNLAKQLMNESSDEEMEYGSKPVAPTLPMLKPIPPKTAPKAPAAEAPKVTPKAKVNTVEEITSTAEEVDVEEFLKNM